jgi:hypothetical protein
LRSRSGGGGGASVNGFCPLTFILLYFFFLFKICWCTCLLYSLSSHISLMTDCVFILVYVYIIVPMLPRSVACLNKWSICVERNQIPIVWPL